MTQKEAVKLLQKYSEGNADQDEINRIDQWYGALPSYQSLAHERKLQIAERMRQHIKRATHSKSAKTKFIYSSWIKIAALLLVTFSIGLLFWKNTEQNGEPETELTAYTNANERKEITLPDSSKIILEPNTKISYPAHFSAEKRIVRLLAGDAFFSVVHEPKRSFLVKLQSDLEVKVLGTSFRIRDIPDEDLMKITVATGKVAVQQASRALGTLIKGDVLSFDKKSGKIAVLAGNRTKVVKIAFDGSSLAEVIEKLEYIYNIKIQVGQQQFLRLKCTADFNSGQEPSEILDILCDLHHLRLSESKDHKRFIIYQ